MGITWRNSYMYSTSSGISKSSNSMVITWFSCYLVDFWSSYSMVLS